MNDLFNFNFNQSKYFGDTIYTCVAKKDNCVTLVCEFGNKYQITKTKKGRVHQNLSSFVAKREDDINLNDIINGKDGRCEYYNQSFLSEKVDVMGSVGVTLATIEAQELVVYGIHKNPPQTHDEFIEAKIKEVQNDQ